MLHPKRVYVNMKIELHKIKNTPIKLVKFKDKVIGCFLYGDNYVSREAFPEEVVATLADGCSGPPEGCNAPGRAS